MYEHSFAPSWRTIVGKAFKRRFWMVLDHPPVERPMKEQIRQQGRDHSPYAKGNFARSGANTRINRRIQAVRSRGPRSPDVLALNRPKTAPRTRKSWIQIFKDSSGAPGSLSMAQLPVSAPRQIDKNKQWHEH